MHSMHPSISYWTKLYKSCRYARSLHYPCICVENGICVRGMWSALTDSTHVIITNSIEHCSCILVVHHGTSLHHGTPTRKWGKCLSSSACEGYYKTDRAYSSSSMLYFLLSCDHRSKSSFPQPAVDTWAGTPTRSYNPPCLVFAALAFLIFWAVAIPIRTKEKDFKVKRQTEESKYYLGGAAAPQHPHQAMNSQMHPYRHPSPKPWHLQFGICGYESVWPRRQCTKKWQFSCESAAKSLVLGTLVPFPIRWRNLPPDCISIISTHPGPSKTIVVTIVIPSRASWSIQTAR